MFTDFINWTGDVCQKFFKHMPTIGNKYNMLIFLGGFVLLFIWLKMQADFNSKADQNNTLK